MKIEIQASKPYFIHLGKGIASSIPSLLPSFRNTLILTDSGVPYSYAESLANRIPNSRIFVFPQGEKSKCKETYFDVLTYLAEAHFSRNDCLIAVGGGVVGDLGGFVASTYMRGIAFYNVPTTLLSMVDSSIGGKTGIDFGGYKNIVGSFYPPRGVFIDPNYLDTLDARQYGAGFAEILKMAATLDDEFFSMLENEELPIETLIEKALLLKKGVVEQDEKESGLRKVLNFGHTLGHAYESCSNGALLHGEAVGLGMLPFSSPEVRSRIRAILKKHHLPTDVALPLNSIEEAIRHDKKGDGDTVDAVFCPKPGKFEILPHSIQEILSLHQEVYHE